MSIFWYDKDMSTGIQILTDNGFRIPTVAWKLGVFFMCRSHQEKWGPVDFARLSL